MSSFRSKSSSESLVEAHTLHTVDTSRAKDGVWLVKVPNYLAELWRNAGPDGVVGKVVIASEAGSSNPGKRPGSQVSLVTDSDLLAQAGENGKLIPMEHQFLIQTTTNPTPTGSRTTAQTPVQRPSGVMSGQELKILCEEDLAISTGASLSAITSASTVSATSNTTSSCSTAGLMQPTATSVGSAVSTQPPFSHTGRYSRRLSLFGRVNSRAECRPPPNARYMMLKAQQVKERNRPRHVVSLIHQPVRNYKPISNHASNIEYEAKKKAEGKNMRREKEDVMHDLFKAFERHQYYAIRDLVMLTKQPLLYLTEILKEIAVFNPRVPHKNMWELKPEYRHYTEDGDAKPSSSNKDD